PRGTHRRTRRTTTAPDARGAGAAAPAAPRSPAAPRDRAERNEGSSWRPRSTSRETSSARRLGLPSNGGSGARRSPLTGDATRGPPRKVRPLQRRRRTEVAAAVARKWWALIGMAVGTALACAATAGAGLITTGSAGYCD